MTTIEPQPSPHDIDAETMVLPAFVTGKKESPPRSATPVRHQRTDHTLPASERGMLVFVAALLGVGTIAVVAVLGVGRLSPSKPAHRVQAPTNGRVTEPAPAPATSASPSPVPSPSSPSPAAVVAPAKTTRARVYVATLGANDPLLFCLDSGAGLARPPRHGNDNWTCTGAERDSGFAFQPIDVCQWKYDNTFAVVGDINDPTSWRCYR